MLKEVFSFNLDLSIYRGVLYIAEIFIKCNPLPFVLCPKQQIWYYIPPDGTVVDKFKRDNKVVQLLFMSWQEKGGTVCSLRTHTGCYRGIFQKRSQNSFRVPNSSVAYVLLQHV